jgi:hypothetical protein
MTLTVTCNTAIKDYSAMHKLVIKGLITGFLLIATVGCTEPMDIEASQRNFFANQESFERVSNVACAVAESNHINFFRYPLDVKGEYADSFKSEFDEFENLLTATDSEFLVIRNYKEFKCELSVVIDGTSFLGEGVSLSYVYQPTDLGNYQYTDDFFSKEKRAYREANRTRGEDVKFSIELKSGWYLQYHLYP